MTHYAPYPAYKDSGVEWIGEVPEHWEVKRLRFIAQFQNSNVDKKSYEGQQAVRLCNYTDVYNNEFITSSLLFMDATASDAEIQAFQIKKGDVIITKDSEDPADIGIPAIVEEDLPGVICGYHLTIIRTNNPEAAEFLHRSIQSHPTKAHFFVESPGITRYGLNQDAIGNIQVCVPPAEELKFLASWINRETARIDALITQKTRFIDLLKEKRQALITRAVTKGLDPTVRMKDSGVEWIGEVPEHWEVKRLRFVASLNPAPNWNSLEQQQDEYPFLPMEAFGETGELDVSRRKSLSDSHSGYTYFAEGDVAFAKVTPCFENGKGAVIHGLEGGHGFGTTELTVLRPHSINRDFLYALTNAICFRQPGASEMLGTSGLKRVPDDFARDYRTPIPPLSEQSAIVAHIDHETARLDALTAKVQESITLLKEHRAALITAAVTGKIDLRGSQETS
jgi:type I restriction enzyme S subunit